MNNNEPRTDWIPPITVLQAANMVNSLTGALEQPTLPASYDKSSIGYAAYHEWIDSVRGRRVPGSKPCSHYRRTISVGGGGFPANLPIYYINSVNSANGIWKLYKNVDPRVAFDNFVLAHATGASVFQCGNLTNPFMGLPVIGSPSFEDRFCLSPLSYPNLMARALRGMLPGIRPAGGLSLLNSLYELKDFRSLPKTLKNIQRLFQKKIVGGMSLRALASKYPREALRRILHAGSDAYLQKEFNIGPLLSDICGVRTALSDVRDKLNKLIKDASVPQRKHYKVLVPDLNNVHQESSWTEPSGYTDRTGSYARDVYYSQKEFNMTIDYSYSLPPTVTRDSLPLALMDRFGVNLNPKIIWNAIPWSFVVDWVIGVNQWLDQYKIRNIEPIVTMRDVSCSLSVKRSISVRGALWGSSCASAVVIEESYCRISGLAPLHSLEASGLSSHELSLLTALLLTRR
jgi:hypothetical protein